MRTSNGWQDGPIQWRCTDQFRQRLRLSSVESMGIQLALTRPQQGSWTTLIRLHLWCKIEQLQVAEQENCSNFRSSCNGLCHLERKLHTLADFCAKFAIFPEILRYPPDCQSGLENLRNWEFSHSAWMLDKSVRFVLWKICWLLFSRYRQNNVFLMISRFTCSLKPSL